MYRKIAVSYTGGRVEGNELGGGGVLEMFDGFGSRLTMALGERREHERDERNCGFGSRACARKNDGAWCD